MMSKSSVSRREFLQTAPVAAVSQVRSVHHSRLLPPRLAGR